MKKPSFSKNDAKGVWAVLWRVLVFGPFVWIAGFAIMLIVIGAFALPPIYATVAFISGGWPLGIAVLIPWFVLLRYRRQIFCWAFGVLIMDASNKSDQPTSLHSVAVLQL